LRPDSDHSDEQRQRGERGGFLDDDFEHGFSPGTEREHSSAFVLESSTHIAEAETIRLSKAYNGQI
jgi:hypothetical protein